MAKVNSKWKIPNCEKQQETPRMPWPCAVEFHASRYKNSFSPSLRCHGLVPWSFTLARTKRVSSKLFKMPRPCAVEFHVCCYKETFFETLQDATALRLGVSRLLLTSTTRKAVASEEFPSAFPVAANVRLHGARPWHLKSFQLLFLVAANVKLYGARPSHLKSFFLLCL